MEEKVQQLNILLQTIKDVVKSRNCPEWISKRLTDAVKRAKELQPAEPSGDIAAVSKYTIDPEIRPFVPNEKVISNVENDPCLYEVVEVLLPVGGVNLYNLKILTGNKNNPPGLIIHNIPETLLQHIKE